MFCPKCGQENIDGSNFCVGCGANVAKLTGTARTGNADTLDVSMTLDGGSNGPQFDTLDAAATQGQDAEILAGQYRILKKLGQGGMGVVYLAEDMELADRPVAIKVLPPALAVNTRAVANLRREALTAIELNHPHVIRLHGFHSDGDIKFLVMEYVDGETLEEKINQSSEGGLPFAETVKVVDQIAAALCHAHERQPAVVHRDLKPSNVMIDRSGHAKVLDFGIAREMKDSFTQVTGKADTSGTLPYMSPEQLRGKRLSASMDIYALGAVCYECLCGHPPFYQGELMYQIIHEMPENLEGVPGPANMALQRALAKDATHRPQTALEFAQLLRGETGADETDTIVIQSSTADDAAESDRLELAGPGSAAYIGKAVSIRLAAWRQDAAAGLAEAQWLLGRCYHAGMGVDLDEAQAVTLYRQAAEQGYAPAQTWLGSCYRMGEGVDQDFGEAVRLYRDAVTQGYADAEYFLGVCHRFGESVPEDMTEALKWYSTAAKHGHAEAQCDLGYFYDEGVGVNQDKAEATRWYQRAADLGYARGQYSVGYNFRYADGVEEDPVEAVKWFRLAAVQGHANAQCELGFCYDVGVGLEQDKAEGVKWYRKSAEQGFAQSQHNLGLSYYYGEGIGRDLAEAVRWFWLAAAQDLADAQFFLGICYAQGDGIKEDQIEAARWYRKAADQCQSGAQCNLGACYALGQGLDKDLRAAVQWYRLSADQGYSNAQYNLGMCYLGGNGVMRRKSQAKKWLQMAAEQGDEDAVEELKQRGWYKG
jgi:uncharacterized protein